MANSADILVSVQDELTPGYHETFMKSQPLMRAILENGGFNKRKMKGLNVLFDVLTGGPGQLTPDRSGAGSLASTRGNHLKQGNEVPFRMIYHWAVPEKDLDEAKTANEMAGLVEKYGKPAMGHAMQIINEQIARGASFDNVSNYGGGASGVATFNGDSNYNPEAVGTNRQGILEFANQAGQTGTVHGLPQHSATTNPTVGWYNQYGNITSFIVNGKRVMRTVYDACSQQGQVLERGHPDLILADDATYQNYMDHQDDYVQTMKIVGEDSPLHQEGLPFRKAVMYSEPEIDLSDTTCFDSTAQTGVAYMLTSKWWEFINIGDMSGDSIFKTYPAIHHPDQPVWVYRMAAYINLYCRSLRNQGAITGGINA